MNPTREEIIKMREQGLTREDMAEHFGVSLTTIRRLIKIHNIPRPSKSARRKRAVHLTSSGEIIAPPDDGKTSLELAHEILGDRLVERRGHAAGLYLDGRPASISRIFEAAGIKKWPGGP